VTGLADTGQNGANFRFANSRTIPPIHS
jgi:hypothetical protein